MKSRFSLYAHAQHSLDPHIMIGKRTQIAPAAETIKSGGGGGWCGTFILYSIAAKSNKLMQSDEGKVAFHVPKRFRALAQRCSTCLMVPPL